MAEQWQQPKDPRVTNESCWKSTDDNLLPNPPINLEHEVDKHYEKLTCKNVSDTKVIMAHEFREDPDSFKAVAQQVADSYNDQHALTVGGRPPIELMEEK